MSGSCGAGVQLLRVPLDLGYKTNSGSDTRELKGSCTGTPSSRLPETQWSLQEAPQPASTSAHALCQHVQCQELTARGRDGAMRMCACAPSLLPCELFLRVVFCLQPALWLVPVAE